MKNMNDSGRPAFPSPYSRVSNPGMSLRDYFAAAALAHISQPHLINQDDWWVAEKAYAIADALLAERSKS